MTLAVRILQVFLVLLGTCTFILGGVSDKMESDFFDNPEISVQISHYFGADDPSDAAYTPRGTVVIRSFKGPRFTTTQKDLAENDLAEIKSLAKSDGYYFLKASVKTVSGDKIFKSFAKAQSLLQSGLSDIIRIHVSPNGEIVAISYALARCDALQHVQETMKPMPLRFNSTVFVHHGEIGPQPDTAPYLEKLEHERLAKERGEIPFDNRSFLAKYWMYIVPIAVMVLLSGASNPEEGGGR